MTEATPALERAQQQSFIIGGIGILLCGVGFFLNRPQFFQSYLMAYMFWIGIALGCLAILMLQHLTGGGWGFVIRRFLESGAKTLPLMALLFLPILLDVFWEHNLYIWSNKSIVEKSEILKHKSAYLNGPFFLIRAVIYFAIWGGAAYFLNKWSTEQDKAADPKEALNIALRLERLSGAGILLYGLTITFAVIDWVMSLEPTWVSSIFGVLVMGGQGLAAFSFVIIVATLLSDRKPLEGKILPGHFHDLGKLMLAFVMLWAYFSLSQYLIIWSANLPEEIPWYLRRQQGGWQWIGLAIILFHFALPFLLLLSRERKRNARRLVVVASFVIFMRLVDLFWVIRPDINKEPFGENGFGKGASFSIHWLDFAAPIGIGGIWLAVFLWQLKARPLLPQHDPYIQEAIGHGGH